MTTLMSTTSKRQLLWIALLANIVWAVLMGWQVKGYYRSTQESCSALPREHGLSNPLTSPIAALSKANSVSEFEAVVDQCNKEENRLWNIHVAQTNTCMDFLFIGLYGSVFLLFSYLLEGPLGRWTQIAIGITMAADVAENVFLLISLHSLTHSTMPTHPWGILTDLKWAFFAVSLLLLSFNVFKRAQDIRAFLRLLMSSLLGLTAIAVLVGIFYLPSLTIGILILAAALLLGLILYFPIHPFSFDRLFLWIEALYLLRFQILAGALIAVILPVSYFAAPSIFLGIFDALGLKSFVFVIWATFQLAWTVMITARMVLVYGPDRFSALQVLCPPPKLPASDEETPAKSESTLEEWLPWRVVVCFGSLALPSVIMTICGTHGVSWYAKVLGSIVGLALSLGMLWLIAGVHAWVEPDPGRTAPQLYPQFGNLKQGDDIRRSTIGMLLDKATIRFLPKHLRGGILKNGRLRSGHQLAATAVLVLLIAYAIAGVLFCPKSPFPPPAAVFFVMFLLNLLTWLFSGIAFLLDVLRIPVLTVTLALSMAFGFYATDHTFHADKPNPPMGSPSPEEVIEKWATARHKAADAPIIVVATAGGGIRASAWTAEVLTRITHDCTSSGDNPFASSLVLISSVSGGSEGAMYVLGSYSSLDGSVDDNALEATRNASSASALNAIGWGILYPDLLRTIPIVGAASGAAFGHEVDRGWALENQWLRNWQKPKDFKAPTLNDWVADTWKGTRPAVIFNSTVSETGQRLVIASTHLAPYTDLLQSGSTSLQFVDKYPTLDIPVSTAARLSATFPWVSPMPSTENDHLHFADGGYYDNSGVLSASEWLMQAQKQLIGRKVLFILIDSTSKDRTDYKAWSWQRQFVAPIGTLLSVRTNSQLSRAVVQLQLVKELLKESGVDVNTYTLSYPSDPLAPLSWHLTPEQKEKIGDAWQHPGSRLQPERQKLYESLGCRVGGTH